MAEVEQAVNLANLGKQALVDLLNNLTQAKEFALSQLPDVCNQYVALGRFNCTAMFIGSILAFIAIPIYLRFVYRRIAHLESDPKIILNVFPSIALMVTSILLFGHSMNCISSWIAPKVYLIREISQLIK